MRHKNTFLRALTIPMVLMLFGMGIIASTAGAEQGIISPEKYFGFTLGSDKNIARWDRIIDYFYLLEKESGKLKVIDMGPSTMNNPFLVVFISAPENLANLDRLQEVNAMISDPRGLEADEIKGLIEEGRAVICQSMSLHATEIGGTQMAPELAYDLVTRLDEETQRILDNVIFVMIPCFNPDGQIMVTDWYRKTLGSKYEGLSLPWLYHKYVGHDNNRDSDFLNMIESVYAAKIMFRDWIPQAYLDHHHMGSYGARFYVPPYGEPIRPYADPLLWREISWYGAHIAYKLEENGKSGILNAAQYPGWGHFGWHWITPFHNIAGMLTESASAKLATPLFIHPEQLRAGARQFPDYEAQSTFPNPWPGGWWRLRDIVEQKKIAAWALLDLAARNKETVLWNAYQKAKRQTERGTQDTPKGYVIPKTQHDPLTAFKMVNTLLQSGIEIKQAQKEFLAGGVIYPEGSFFISLSQPKRGLILNLLGRTFYADNAWTRASDGSPLRPYDMATHTMHEFMGVRVDPVDEAVDGDFRELVSHVSLRGKVAMGDAAYVLDGRLNDSFKAVNFLIDRGVGVRRVDEASSASGLRPGDFILSDVPETVLRDVAEKTGVTFTTLEREVMDGIHDVKRMRVGMYQRYWGGNMDEGWTRFLLEQFAFPYKSLMDAEIKRGGLNAKYDVIILPDDSPGMITGERVRTWGGPMPAYPPEYRSGIGKEGVEALKAFVEKGGTMVALGDACALPIDNFGLPVRDVVEDIDSKEFFCPGSTLRVTFDNTNPLAYGMPSEGLVLFWSSPAFAVTPSQHNERYETVARYADRDILQSGWLIGEEHLSRKAALVSAEYGEGQVVLIGFRTQHRSQTHGTFKLLFNALLR